MPGAPENWLQVVRDLQAGDRVALVQMTRLISGFLMRYRAYDVRDQWDDLIQEVLAALLRSLDREALREPRALVNYVGRITRNKLFDLLEQKRRPGAPDLVGEPAQAPAAKLDSAPPDVYVDLGRALELLPEKLRAVVDAIYLQGLAGCAPITNGDDLCNVSDILGANAKIFGQPAHCARWPAP